jgi:hypothetical protein
MTCAVHRELACEAVDCTNPLKEETLSVCHTHTCTRERARHRTGSSGQGHLG